MPTTHIFIVNHDSFPIHLNYMFAGTGAGDKDLHFGLLADISRIRPGDLAIFYMEKLGFYGTFEIVSYAFQDLDKPNYLLKELNKKLIYRVLIKPKEVYSKGVSEWNALDKLPQYAQEVIWSLIYRKLKGWRGCTPINLQESDRLVNLIKEANSESKPLFPNNNQCLTFDKELNEIKISDNANKYIGKQEKLKPMLSEMIERDKYGYAYEDRLQVFFMQNIGKNKKLELIVGPSKQIVWIGNEVYCGFGMQKIDVFTILSDERDNKTYNLIELKCWSAYPDIIYQLKRYADWCSVYIKGAINSNIQPVVVTRVIDQPNRKNGKPYKSTILREDFKNKLQAFNKLNISKEVKWFEFYFKNVDILFEEIKY